MKAALAARAIPVGHIVWELKGRGISARVASAGCKFVSFDKAAGFQPGSRERVRWALSRAFTCLSYGVDSAVYRQALLGSVAEARRLVGEGGLHG